MTQYILSHFSFSCLRNNSQHNTYPFKPLVNNNITESNKMKNKKLKRLIMRTVIIVFACLLSTYAGLRIWIWGDAKQFAKQAVEHFNTDRTSALILYLDSNEYTFKEKNKAVWAMGVLKEKNALPKLEMMYTGEECNHDSAICQYELYKAIHKIKGDFKGSWQAKN